MSSVRVVFGPRVLREKIQSLRPQQNCLNWFALCVYEWSSIVEVLDESVEALRRQLPRVTRFPEDFKKGIWVRLQAEEEKHREDVWHRRYSDRVQCVRRPTIVEFRHLLQSLRQLSMFPLHAAA